LRSVFVLYPNNSDRFYFITGDLLLLFSDDLLLPKTAGAKLLFTQIERTKERWKDGTIEVKSWGNTERQTPNAERPQAKR